MTTEELLDRAERLLDDCLHRLGEAESTAWKLTRAEIDAWKRDRAELAADHARMRKLADAEDKQPINIVPFEGGEGSVER